MIMSYFYCSLSDMLFKLSFIDCKVRDLRLYFECVKKEMDYPTVVNLDNALSTLERSVSSLFLSLLAEREDICDTQQ